MKRTMQRIAMAAALFMAAAGYGQTNNPPWVWSPILDMVGKSNLVAGPFVTYDDTVNAWGGGFFLGYKLTEMIVPIFRLEQVREDAYGVSGNIQLELPIDIGKSSSNPGGVVRLTPFTFAGIATSWNNQSGNNDGGPIGIFGIGTALTFKTIDKWYLPSGLAADWERWTGSGFNDDQFRIGPFWKF